MLSPSSWAAEKAQLTLGDKISVFSDKAYRKNNGRYFEAVGNVVIISQKDTVYGELASLDQETMMVKVEGNVRLITKDMTLYGSHLEYNIPTGVALLKNARILTSEFNLVAQQLMRISADEYLAHEAEFTTCKDCAESWSVFGKQIRMKANQYVQIRHAMARIKGVNVVYLPYIVLPLQSKRKTGLLFPKPSTRLGEGIAIEQPIFVAIDESKDATLSPTFWAKRGYGGDVQYRQRFSDLSWLELNTRMLNDTIYRPGKTNSDKSGDEFFRYFTEIDSHQQWTPNIGSQMYYTGARDLDVVRDHPQYTDPKIIGSDLGFKGNINWRRDLFSLGAEGNYSRNQLVSDPLLFDRSYVQTMPRLTLSTTPYTIYQSQTPMLENITLGVDSSFTRFRQVDEQEGTYLRNADRISSRPYLMWHFLTLGPVGVKARYTLDQQTYHFAHQEEGKAGKSAGLLQTEFSFTMDKVFGLAYEEKIPVKYIPEEDLKKLRERKEQGLTPLRETKKENRLIGDLSPFESELARDTIIQVKNSYRHSQEFKFIHHFVTSEDRYGNKQFLTQIQQGQAAWFDSEDAIRTREYLFGASTRTIIPPENTVEFQWNNTLIRKTPKNFSYLDDDKFLRDNFSYSRIGHFNISQGYILDENAQTSRERLTRLKLDTGYQANRWFLGLTEYYFHADRKSVRTLNVNRRFDYLNIFSAYNYNPFPESNLKLLSVGGQVRPLDVLGLAMMKDMDLFAKRDIRTTYSVDIMPNNNCWILNLNFRQSLNNSQFSFNLLFNFGDDKFERYRTDYFAVKRL